MRLDFKPKHCEISLSPETPLAELSFSLQQCYEWLFGRGVNRFAINRKMKADGGCHIIINALGSTGDYPCQFSCVALMKNVYKIFPENLEAKLVWGDSESPTHAFGPVSKPKPVVNMVLDSGLYRTLKDQDFTVFESRGVDLENTLGSFCYGLADLCTALFALGITTIQHQHSQKLVQTKFNVKFTDKKIYDFFNAPIDYDVQMPVKNLPTKGK